MRCAISSSAGQILARGRLLIQKDENNEQRLTFVSDRGKLVSGGIVGEDGELTAASEELFRGFFAAWGVSGVTLIISK
ncbi:hypothetical protein ACE1B6_17025 [Aerosakkonemataceae cyanobacterium BLCC-F154]|uniref:Uncharacterized protein n=1 Tax=Floridaenema fluviatile BLCC-F154 TaxID=3153640 RepID=A0ABV4YEK5_9CYAN